MTQFPLDFIPLRKGYGSQEQFLSELLTYELH